MVRASDSLLKGCGFDSSWKLCVEDSGKLILSDGYLVERKIVKHVGVHSSNTRGIIVSATYEDYKSPPFLLSHSEAIIVLFPYFRGPLSEVTEEEEMGLAGGAAAEDAEAEYIRKVTETEVVTGKNGRTGQRFCAQIIFIVMWLTAERMY